MLARILIFSLFVSAAASAAELFSDQQIESVSQNLYWKRLLHYRNGQSEADGSDFFLSPQGKKNPKAELLADIAAFKDPNAKRVGPIKQHPQCAFPERYRFLKKELGLQITDEICKDFAEWRSHFREKSIVVVYAAAYMGSPASMFGHTFLRVDSEPRPGQITKNDLLDYTISYEAAVGPDPGPAYALKGVIGLYPGYFSMSPYYLKTNNYTSMDSRDLWEYKLNLNPDQMDRLINHVWETGTTYFNYYFFDRNCSYHLLSLLEVANLDWDLRSRFSAYAIPIDTVRAITEIPGAIKDVQVRPSILRVLRARLSRMTEAEQDRFYLLKENISAANSEDSAKVLDALMDWQKFVALSKAESIEQAQVQIDRKLLLLRVKKEETETFELEKLTPPDQGHASAKVVLSAGTEGRDNFLGLEARPAFHDLLGPDLGYLPQSELIGANLRVSTLLSERKVTRLDEFTIASVTNFEPLTRLQKKFSWTIGGGLKRPLDLECLDCVSAILHGGGGLTLPWGKSNWTFLLTGHAETSSAFPSGYRAAPGISAFLLFPMSDRWKFSAGGESLRYFSPNEQTDLTKAEINLSYLLKSADLKAQWSNYRTSRRNVEIGSLSVGWYF